VYTVSDLSNGVGMVEAAWPALRQLLPGLNNPHLEAPTMLAVQAVDSLTAVRRLSLRAACRQTFSTGIAEWGGRPSYPCPSSLDVSSPLHYAVNVSTYNPLRSTHPHAGWRVP
jgi:hypothetical protein